MEDFSFDVTDKDIEEYEAYRLKRIEKFAKDAPDGVSYNWVPPQLKPNGSLTYEERQKQLGENAKAADTWKR